MYKKWTYKNEIIKNELIKNERIKNELIPKKDITYISENRSVEDPNEVNLDPGAATCQVKSGSYLDFKKQQNVFSLRTVKQKQNLFV